MNVCVRSLSLLVGLSLPLVACGDSGGEGGGAAGGSGQGGGATTSTSSGTTSTATTTGQGGGGGSTGEGGAGGEPACNVTIPGAYDGSTFAANAAGELAIRARGAALNDVMRTAETNNTAQTLQSLVDLYEDGTPSVKSLTTTYYDGVIVGTLTDFAAAAGSTWVPAATPVAPGGKYGNYLFNEDGVDLRQTYEKGLFQALWLPRFVEVADGTIDQVALDRLLAMYGAHPDFPGNSESTDTVAVPNPDRLVAQYAERRSPKNVNDSTLPLDPQNPGPYFRIKQHFITVQATLDSDEDACVTLREESLAALRDEWERAMAATVVYYFNDASVKLTTEPPTDALLSGGLHGYNEGVAFLHGFRTLPAGARTITDAQVDDLLELVGAPPGGPIESYKLVTDAATEVTNLATAMEDLQDLYGFTEAEMLAFRTNY